MDKEEATETGISVDNIKRQGSLLQKLSHNHIVGFHGIIDLSQAFCLITEKCNGEILTQLSQSSSYTEANGRTLVTQILEAVKYLHQQNVVHSSLMVFFFSFSLVIILFI